MVLMECELRLSLDVRQLCDDGLQTIGLQLRRGCLVELSDFVSLYGD